MLIMKAAVVGMEVDPVIAPIVCVDRSMATPASRCAMRPGRETGNSGGSREMWFS